MKIHSLGYVGVSHSDPSQWSEYGKNVLGMEDNSTAWDDNEDSVYLKMDDRPYRILIEKGKAGEEGLLFSGWELTGPEAFQEALQTLQKHDIAFEQAEPSLAASRRVQELASFFDPDGNKHEIYWGPISDFKQFASPQGIHKFVTNEQGLGHIVLPTPSFDASLNFYKDVMGFDLSDLMKVRFTPDPNEPEKRLYFMHCNKRHHSLAIFESPMPAGCVHLMVEVDKVDEVGRAMDRMQAHNVKLTGTLGRHANDHMVSFYMASPSGFMIEYGAEGRTVEDWSQYSSFQSTVNSFWGHDFSVGME